MIRRVAIYILLSGWPYRDPSRLSVKLASRRGVPAFRLLGTIAWSVLFTFEPRSGRTPSRLTTGPASVALNPTKVCGGGIRVPPPFFPEVARQAQDLLHLEFDGGLHFINFICQFLTVGNHGGKFTSFVQSWTKESGNLFDQGV